jgi:hypothetical protein
VIILQTWIYDQIPVYRWWGGREKYKEDLPRASKCEPIKGQTNEAAVRLLMDRVLPHDITWRPYARRGGSNFAS